ncbi:hypothetical protein AB0H34_00865 [Saccharopolyspora shandongensis]|uniref:dual OB domain-containing protein n=1 Tax=Saccharopolyspora shandongensis TaxID=418495 RepID=UPI0033FB43B7
MTKLLVCLANSRKHRERCIAGIEIGSRKWIRPVSNRPGHGVSELERQYPSKVEPKVLDVISVPLVEARPNDLHRENWLLDSTARWSRIGRIGWRELCDLEQLPTSLWINGYHTSAGTNDRIPAEQREAVIDSLKLIRVDGVKMEVSPAHPMSNDTRPTVRAQFRHAGSEYAVKVTDPICEEKFRTRGLGKYGLGESFLTVSLSEEFQGNFYKLVAAIVERAEVEPGGRQ